MTGRFLYVQNAYGGPPPALTKVSGHTIQFYQQYDTERLDWSTYDAVLISMSADQVHLNEISPKLQAYLNGGGTLLINGHVARPFLPELSRYEPMEKRGLKELVIHREKEHPLFQHISAESLTLRKGVAGFYGRGTNPPPTGALVIHSVGPDHVAVDWLYDRPEGGRIFVHSGVELWAVLMLEGPQGLPVIQGFFDWLSQTSKVAA